MHHQTAMRVGIVQSGRLVEEKICSERTVTVGPTIRSSVIVPGDQLAARWRLFERRGGRYRLRPLPAMQGKVSDGDRMIDLRDRRTPLDLPARARGRVSVGDVVILFQIVVRPQVPVTRLPHALRGSMARELDRAFALLAFLSFAAHLAAVLYLRRVDWPRQPEIDELPDRFIHQVLHRPPPAPAPTAIPAPTPAPTVASHHPALARPRPSVADQRQALIERVNRKGILQVLSALGPGGTVRDLLRDGSVDREQAQAMRDLGGVTVAEEGSALPLGKPSGSGGRVADVIGLREGGRISAANVEGRGAERRVAVRTAAPTIDEPVAGFDAQLLGKTIRDRLAEIRACYERALKQRASTGGKLVLRFTLTPAGTVSSVDVDEDTLHDGEVTACVKAAVSRWRFPAPPRIIEVSFPFVFQPTS